MKKSFLLFSFLVVGILVISAESNISVSGLWLSETSKSGGGLEIGFPLLDSEEWLIRNNITLKGAGSSSTSVVKFGEISLEEKILVGGNIDRGEISFRPYGYISGAGGLINLESWVLDLGMGGGFEICFTTDMGFYIEYGGAMTLPLAGKSITINGGTAIAMGYRIYL